MFTTFVVQPIFNLLVFIYAILPGHNFGVALIIFTIIIRLLLWPVVKKQLHQTKAMRALQPDIKRIKKATKGNRAKESQMLMELYKEKGINPIGTLPILIIQLIVLLGLYSGLRKVIDDPSTLYTFAYAPLQHLPWIQHLHENIKAFDDTFLGFVNLSQAAYTKATGIYWPAMIIVAGSAIATYYQSKQLMPQADEKRGLRTILKEAGQGKQADQSEVNTAVMGSTLYFIPIMIFIVTVGLPSALGLYWLVSGIVAYIQQSIVLNRDEEEMESIADGRKDVKSIPEAEIVEKPANSSKAKKKPTKKKRKKR